MTPEELASVTVRTRGAGQCECCRMNAITDKSHRVNRSQGGTWALDNVLGACNACHGWFHGERDLAHVAGWILQTGKLAAEVIAQPGLYPVWLNSLTLDPNWYYLTPDGQTITMCSPGLNPPPLLPPWVPPAILPAPRITVQGAKR